tara:strand:- start:1900 stop:2130 length:231 start_codon:yes stop_codon:yes gene_type:complete
VRVFWFWRGCLHEGDNNNSNDFEFKSSAERLAKTHGIATVDYVNRLIETMKDLGDGGKQAYWEKILKETENLSVER